MIRRRRNLDGYMEGGVFHPIRGSEGYDDERLGDTSFDFGSNTPAERKKAEKEEKQRERWEYEQRQKELAARKKAARLGRHTFTGAGEDDYTQEGLAHFVRRMGGIRTKPGDPFEGEVDRLSPTETGTTGLIRRVGHKRGGLHRGYDNRGGLTAEYMRDAAVEHNLIGEDVSIDGFLGMVEDSVALERKGAKRRNPTWATFNYRADGAYKKEDRLKFYMTQAQAERAAEKASGSGAKVVAMPFASAKNPKQKRKPLAREFGESDTGTQPRLFIMGDKKHAGQETMEALFAEGEKMPAKKKNTGEGRARRLMLAAEKSDAHYKRALAAQRKQTARDRRRALDIPHFAEAANEKARRGRAAAKKRNFKVSAAGKLRIGKNPGVNYTGGYLGMLDLGNANKTDKGDRWVWKSKFYPVNADRQLIKDTATEQIILDGRTGRVTLYMYSKFVPNPPSGYVRDKQEERAYKLLQKAAHRYIHAKTPAGKKKAEKAYSAAEKTFHRAQAAAVTRRRVGVGIDNPKKRRNVSIKVGGRSKFRATKKGVTIGGRVTLKANPNTKRRQRLASAVKRLAAGPTSGYTAESNKKFFAKERLWKAAEKRRKGRLEHDAERWRAYGRRKAAASKNPLPAYLDSRPECNKPYCEGGHEGVVKRRDAGHWYITIGHAGFNSSANNRDGYATKAAALAAHGRYNAKGRGSKNPGVRVVYNRLLGGWYVVTGPHQTPLNGRFDSKAEAQAWLKRKNPGAARVSRLRTAAAKRPADLAAFERFKTASRKLSGRRLGKPARIPRYLGSRRLNPGGIFEKFHGRRATKENVLNAPDGTPKRLDKLGKLVSLHAEGGTIKPRATVWLCADSRGKLHLCTSAARLIDGGPQNFGQVKKIEYETTKNHLDNKPTIYYHHFGEEGGARPTLHSDGRGGLKLKGGAYKIRAEGIRN